MTWMFWVVPPVFGEPIDRRIELSDFAAVIKGSWTPKLSYTFYPFFLKVQNFLITLTVISAPSILSTRKNLPLKSTIYENDVENAPP